MYMLHPYVLGPITSKIIIKTYMYRPYCYMGVGNYVESHYNNNNNKQICIAQVCRMTSEALGGQLQSCYTARARPKCLTEEKCFKTTLEQS